MVNLATTLSPLKKWVASENTQTPNFQIFPGQMGMPIPDEMGCGKKNRKGGGAPPFYFFLEILFENLFDYCRFLSV